MKQLIISVLLCGISFQAGSWGFYAHRLINYYAVFLLPPDMFGFYKQHIHHLATHATDPDSRRYVVDGEAPRHYIDIDLYGTYPFPDLPRNMDSAIARYTADTVHARGIVPWHILRMKQRLTAAFRDKHVELILKYSAEIGHYIADAHVPLHTSHNHNGQYTNQHGIHGLWESSIPELLAEPEFDFFIGKAEYLSHPDSFIWTRVLESAAASDSVLLFEKKLSEQFNPAMRYNFEERNGKTVRQFSASYTRAYNKSLNGMVERRMRLAVYSIASFWYTAWVDAGQPALNALIPQKHTHKSFNVDSLQKAWLQDTGNGCD